MADIHTHMIPGVDDGAPDIESALETLKMLWGDGVTAVAATPHLNASRPHGNRRLKADEAWPQLLAAAQAKIPDLSLQRGFEILLDIPDIDLDDPDLRIAGSRFALVEFHAFTIPQFSAYALGRIRESGYVPILAHPERYWGYDREMTIVPEWRAAGVLLQLNGGSLLGESGDGIRVRAQRMLENGWIDLIASDNHARAPRVLSLGKVWKYMADLGLADQARLLLAENPHRILRDEMPSEVGPVRGKRGKRSLWSRLVRTFIGGDR